MISTKRKKMHSGAHALAAESRAVSREVILQYVAHTAAGACIGNDIPLERLLGAIREAHTLLGSKAKILELLADKTTPARDTMEPITPLDFLPEREG